MVCVIAILGTALVALLYSYFYIRLYSPQWPQGNSARPDLLPFGIAYGLLLLTAPSLFIANRCFRKGKANAIQFAFTAVLLLALGFLATSLYAILDYGISAQQTAYGSLFYLLSSYPWLLGIVGMSFIANAQARVWREHADREGFSLPHPCMPCFSAS